MLTNFEHSLQTGVNQKTSNNWVKLDLSESVNVPDLRLILPVEMGTNFKEFPCHIRKNDGSSVSTQRSTGHVEQIQNYL
jgi:hypothetical protein